MRVLLVSSHPVQYAAPLYRRYSGDPDVEVTVAFCSLHGVERALDREFGVEVQWDVPLLEGYRWTHLKNVSPRASVQGFFGLINPGLWRLITKGDFDVVLCYGWKAISFWIAIAATKISGAALILTTEAQGMGARSGSRWKAAVRSFVLPRLFRLADLVFSTSTKAANFVESLGVPRSRIRISPYVVDTTFFSEAAKRADRRAVRTRWGVPDDALLALFVGKLVPWKRPLDLVAAIAQTEHCWAVFAGEGEQRSAIEAQARAMGVAHRCRFVGFINQTGLPEAYTAADVLVLPSSFEPFGVVVNEAFACGIPAIVSAACGSAGDLVSDGETGFIVPPGDPTALASRLQILAHDRALLATMAQNATARIECWGPEQNAAAFSEACRTVRVGDRTRTPR